MIRPARHLVRAWLACASSLSLLLFADPASPSANSVTVNSPHRNAPDAFLPLRATSVESVLEQLESDPPVLRHYARYFHLPPSRVVSYLRTNLVPSRLSRGGLYTVYYVRSNGLIYPTIMKASVGLPVFALKNGSPLLTWNEGNPLTRTQKAVRLGAKVKPAPPRAPVDPPPPVQIIVPTRVQTTIIPPLPPPTTDTVPSEPAAPATTGTGAGPAQH